MSAEQLARFIADAASKSDAAYWPEAVAIALGPVIAAAQAEAWDEGFGRGWNDCLLDLQNGGVKASVNHYRAD